MDLKEYFAKEKAEADRDKILLVDAHNLVYRTLFIANLQEGGDPDFKFWKHLFINSIFTMLQKINPKRVVLAFDSKFSWRKEVYPEYKAHRKLAREQSAIDFEKFFPILEQMITEIKSTFTNMMVIKMNGAEADDTIAIICKHETGIEKIIVSSDKDLNQLINENTKQWDPIKQSFVKCLNPQKELELKLIMGDKGDNIPAIRPKVGIKTAEKILAEGNYFFDENYKRNLQLIDLNNIPKPIVENIKNIYTTYALEPANMMNILKWLMKNELRKLADDLQINSKYLKDLK
jgi:5'-3' exonuclease